MGTQNRRGGARPTCNSQEAQDETTLPVAEPATFKSPLEYLLFVMNDVSAPKADRLRAAITAAQYKNTKTKDGGKKEGRADAAERVASGKFAPSAPPKLVSVK